MKNYFDYRGRHVLITGATGGIGQALAQDFYQAGATIHASGRSQERLQSLQESYAKSEGDRYLIWPFDLSQSKDIPEYIRTIESQGGPIDILINNGGITQDSLSLRMKDEAWDQVLQVNLTAPFLLAREAARGMMRRKWGRIINISSIVGAIGNPGQANYAAAKAGMIGWTKTMAQEIARWHVTVNAIAPGFIETKMTQDLSGPFKDAIPCGRLGQPDDIAYAALFLASPHASYITGETLHVNGGLRCI